MDRGACLWGRKESEATKNSTAQKPGVPQPERGPGLWAPELSSG